jgi:hypothetical protein
VTFSAAQLDRARGALLATAAGDALGESALENLARLAADVEAGNAEPYPGWRLGRPQPGVLAWTTPSGRRHASDLKGQALPLP